MERNELLSGERIHPSRQRGNLGCGHEREAYPSSETESEGPTADYGDRVLLEGQTTPIEIKDGLEFGLGPAAQAVLGKREGDEVVIPLKDRVATHRITRIEKPPTE